MSTKIYLAYRCPIGTFYKVFIPSFRKHCFDKVVERVKTLVACVKPEILEKAYEDKDWQKQMTFERFCEKKGELFKLREVLRAAYKASVSSQRDPYFCIDCSFNVWLYKGKAYIIPYGEYWITETFEMPEGVEDYSYWNNSDEPEGVTLAQWRSRGKIWGKVCLDNHNERRLLHQVVDVSSKPVPIGLNEVTKAIMPDDDSRFFAFYDLEGKY